MYHFSEAQRVGLEAEMTVLETLQGLGYEAGLVSRWEARYDILLEGLLPIEVKFAHQTWRQVRPGYYRQRWQWDLSGGLNRAKVDYLFILVAHYQGQDWHYIIPSYWTSNRIQAQITSPPGRYKGYLAEGLENWPLIDEVLEVRRRYSNQLHLPIGELLQ